MLLENEGKALRLRDGGEGCCSCMALLNIMLSGSFGSAVWVNTMAVRHVVESDA